MRLLHKLLLVLSFCTLTPAMADNAPDNRAGCDSCRIEIKNLDEPVKLAGSWLFTRDDSPANKDVNADTRHWRLAQAPGPWKNIYGDQKIYTVGWYRGALEFDSSLIGQEVVFLVNTYMGRMNVYVDGQEVYTRPHNMNVERYYSVQAIPVRFKVTQARHVVAFRVDTPLMTGVYQLPFEIHKYDQHDTSLALWQIWGGEARTIAAYSMLTFGLFFLLVYAKTRYMMYLVASLAGILIFPFFAGPGDYFLKIFAPETMLFVHYLGLMGIFMFFLFGQFVRQKFTPKSNWVFGAVYLGLTLAVGSVLFVPNLELFQKARPILFITTLVTGALGVYQLVRATMEKKQGALLLCAAEICFLLTGFNDVGLALGKFASVSMIFAGTLVFMCAMMYVASLSFANTFVENRKLVKSLKVMNDNLEDMVTERTEQLRQKTQDIQSMMQNMPQGVLTIMEGSKVHPEYSAYLETIFETKDIAGQGIMELIFSNSNLGADTLSQIDVAAASCVGEDSMNFEFNSHLLVSELDRTMPDGRVKSLGLSWSPICDANDVVEKLMLCIRDETEVKRLEREASHQKRELAIIGEILKVSQEKFNDFIESSVKFIDENRQIIESAADKQAEVVNLLFRNMHTIKGNARTFGFLNMTNLVHETEQAYDELRKDEEAVWQPERLLAQLDEVKTLIEEYARINDKVLGRKGPGRRGSVEKYVMVEKTQVAESLHLLANVDMNDMVALRGALTQMGRTLNLIGTERMDGILAGVVDSLPSLAHELGKEAPIVSIQDRDILVRTQASSLLKNIFTHLLRNSMDHGIETAEVRTQSGKTSAGRIDIDLSLTEGKLWIRLKDDGKGLAIGRLRQRAVQSELLTEDQASSAEAVAQTIFQSGMSTAEHITEVSGRGVGMDAVKGFLQKEGGDIHIQFLDDRADAEFRAFQMVIELPDKYATPADFRQALSQRVVPQYSTDPGANAQAVPL